jgi:Putative zinc-finger
MTCSDVQRVLPEVLDGGPNGTVATEFETHIKNCPDCSDLVSDLKLIASEVYQLAATDEPSPRVWIGIAAQLRAEGLIREPQSVAGRPVLLPTSPRRRWSALWLAPVAAALVAAGSYLVNHKPAAPVARQQTPGTSAPATNPEAADKKAAQITTAPDVFAPAPASQELAQQKSTAPTGAAQPIVEAESSADDQQFLSVVSTRAPTMRATYENQLAAVNADIRETQAYVNRNPGDPDARQHLMDAYQQKALLYQIALDRIQ